VEYRITLPDGTERIVHGDGKIELDDSGAPIGITGYYQDVTEQRRAEAEIRRLNAELEERVVTRTAELTAVTKELEAFAYSTSHDLRAPLRAIDGFSLMVLEDAAAVLAPDDVRHLERVREAAQRMGRLIDDLLGLSRMAQRPLDRERVDVSALAREVSDELLAEHQDRVMDVVIAPDMVANADPHLLRVILRNTLENAWKFTAKRAKARIEVGVIDADPERAFFVRDDGAGFDMRYADHLFGAFQRMHRAEEYPGDGIGLAMVQRLVNRHGGTAWAESQIEQGSTIFFTLPAPTNG
jgi:light-regulated signal transduction histidine kinase (bacteriophytochrome)